VSEEANIYRATAQTHRMPDNVKFEAQKLVTACHLSLRYNNLRHNERIEWYVIWGRRRLLGQSRTVHRRRGGPNEPPSANRHRRPEVGPH